MKTLKWLSARMKERSTWIGLTAVLSSVGVAMNPELADSIITLGVAAGGFVAVVTKDKV